MVVNRAVRASASVALALILLAALPSRVLGANKFKAKYKAESEALFTTPGQACRDWIKRKVEGGKPSGDAKEDSDGAFRCFWTEANGYKNDMQKVDRFCPPYSSGSGSECVCDAGYVVKDDTCVTEEVPAATGPDDGSKGGKEQRMAEHKVECFNSKGAAKTPAKVLEYKAQLDRQQAGLNEMSLADFVGGMASYADKRQSGPAGARQATADAQKKLREAEKKKLTDALTQDLKSQGRTDAQINLRVQRALKKFASLAVLHEPDTCVAGDKVSCMGDGSINSSIGAQWPLPRGAYEDDSRRYRLLAAVMKALETLDPESKVNAVLEICPR